MISLFYAVPDLRIEKIISKRQTQEIKEDNNNTIATIFKGYFPAYGDKDKLCPVAKHEPFHLGNNLTCKSMVTVSGI